MNTKSHLLVEILKRRYKINSTPPKMLEEYLAIPMYDTNYVQSSGSAYRPSKMRAPK